MKKDQNPELLKGFGENLKKIREAKGHSLRSLATECKIDHSDIGKMEKGEINITILTLFELAKALEIKPKKLIEFEID